VSERSEYPHRSLAEQTAVFATELAGAFRIRPQALHLRRPDHLLALGDTRLRSAVSHANGLALLNRRITSGSVRGSALQEE
jgi:hypothetical protein